MRRRVITLTNFVSSIFSICRKKEMDNGYVSGNKQGKN